MDNKKQQKRYENLMSLRNALKPQKIKCLVSLATGAAIGGAISFTTWNFAYPHFLQQELVELSIKYGTPAYVFDNNIDYSSITLNSTCVSLIAGITAFAITTAPFIIKYHKCKKLYAKSVKSYEQNFLKEKE